jgi:hypothetical protein
MVGLTTGSLAIYYASAVKSYNVKSSLVRIGKIFSLKNAAAYYVPRWRCNFEVVGLASGLG